MSRGQVVYIHVMRHERQGINEENQGVDGMALALRPSR
jgi:hypothetical protein